MLSQGRLLPVPVAIASVELGKLGYIQPIPFASSAVALLGHSLGRLAMTSLPAGYRRAQDTAAQIFD